MRVAGTTPYYGANGIQDYVDGYTHDGEFILVAEDGANDLKNYPVKCVKGRIWVNNHAHVLQGKYDCADNQFLAYAISQADIESLLVGGGRAKLNAETLMGIDLLLPNKAEQIRIGKYLAQLDNLITLHQCKCQIDGCRFQSPLAITWEQRKFDKWGDFYYGHSCPKWSVTEDATIPCIRYGELYTKFGAKIDKVYSYTNMPTEKLRFSKGTEVLIPRVGEDPMDYNHCTWLSLKDVAIGEMISVFNTDQDPLFSATMFNATLQKEFAIRVEGGSVTNLYFDKLRNIDISYPLLAEQKKIAAFFENLDHLITLHQCE